jgi:hypothetical protein
VFVRGSKQPGVSREFGGEAIHRECCSIDLHEPLLDEDLIVVLAKVGEHRVGPQHSPASTARPGQRMDYLVTPRERTEVIATIAGFLEEADRGVVDRESVEAKLPSRGFRGEDLRGTVDPARLNRDSRPGLGDKPQSPR